MDYRGSDAISAYSMVCDDVTSIKTEQYKLSAREHNMLENHLFSQSQSRDSLAPVATSGFVNELHYAMPTDSVDG